MIVDNNVCIQLLYTFIVSLSIQLLFVRRGGCWVCHVAECFIDTIELLRLLAHVRYNNQYYKLIHNKIDLY